MKQKLHQIFLMLPLWAFSSDNLSINQSVELSWGANTGYVYQVQYCTNLTEDLWFNLGDPIICDTTNISAFNSTKNSSKRYYRVTALGSNSDNSSMFGVYEFGDFPNPGTERWSFFSDGRFINQIVSDVNIVSFGEFAYSDHSLFLQIDFSTDDEQTDTMKLISPVSISDGNLSFGDKELNYNSAVMQEMASSSFWSDNFGFGDQETTPE
ncbi:hypothetical protein [Pontiella agarivorans]|uniref:Uncharacterized protein n=1 Tax=Pontiella agarivorans TaxID=3038953 RepID=A0ABU5MVK1_9BACT|nr:hypothetical protein [Pontiella agarivorans]MDZ8118266.1 hypothetical protein [Pontiella agarivorans]